MRMLLILALAACGGDANDTDTGEEGMDTPPDTWETFAEGFFATNCVNCHSASPKDFRSLADVTAQATPIRCIVSPTALGGCDPSIAANHPAWNKPSDAERERLVAWIDDGLPAR